MRIILKDIEPDDWMLAVRAAKYLKARFQQDAWVSYGGGDGEPPAKEFYAKRNKASITVRACAKSPANRNSEG